MKGIFLCRTALSFLIIALPVFVHPAEKIYVSAVPNHLFVLNPITDEITKSLEVGLDPSALGFSPLTGYVYVVNSGGNSISVVDPGEDVVVTTIKLPGSPMRIAIAPNEYRAYTFLIKGRDTEVGIIDLGTNEYVGTLIPLAPTNSCYYQALDCLAASSDGKVYIARSKNPVCDDRQPLFSPIIVDTHTGKMDTLSVEGTLVALSLDETIIYVGMRPFFMLDADTYETIGTIHIPKRYGGWPGTRSIALSPDGKTAYAVGSLPNELFLIDLEMHTVRNSVILADREFLATVALTRNAQALYVTSPSGIVVIDIHTLSANEITLTSDHSITYVLSVPWDTNTPSESAMWGRIKANPTDR